MMSNAQINAILKAMKDSEDAAPYMVFQLAREYVKMQTTDYSLEERAVAMRFLCLTIHHLHYAITNGDVNRMATYLIEYCMGLRSFE